MSNIPQHILDEQDTIKIATDAEIKSAQVLAKEYSDISAKIAHAEAELKKLSERKRALESREIPDLFATIGVDVIGLPSDNCDVTVRPYYKASIPVSWEQEKKDEAFNWLESNGHGDIISVVVSVSFKRGEKELSDSLVRLIKNQFQGANSHGVDVSMTVPWGTLTALVKEQVEKGESVPLETLGATVGQVAKIVKRKK